MGSAREQVPYVSVVMAVYNEKMYINESIQSILNQTFSNFELIIIDDGSFDDTSNIIQNISDKRIRYFRLDHGGLPKALNFGIKKSKSNFIARMDGDDIALPDRLENQLAFLEKNKDCVAVGGDVDIINHQGEFLYHQEVPKSNQDIRKCLPNIPMYHSSIVFRKNIFLQAGMYDEKLFTAQDKLLFNRMSNYGKLNNINNIVLKYRISPTAISRRTKKVQELLNKTISKIIDGKYTAKSDYKIINDIYLTTQKSSRIKKSIYYQTMGKIFIEKSFNRSNAFINLCKSIWLNPLLLRSWYNLCILILPSSIIQRIKKQ